MNLETNVLPTSNHLMLDAIAAGLNAAGAPYKLPAIEWQARTDPGRLDTSERQSVLGLTDRDASGEEQQHVGQQWADALGLVETSIAAGQRNWRGVLNGVRVTVVAVVDRQAHRQWLTATH